MTLNAMDAVRIRLLGSDHRLETPFTDAPAAEAFATRHLDLRPGEFVIDHGPASCRCSASARVSECCGEPMRGDRCTWCGDPCGAECATCEQEIAS